MHIYSKRIPPFTINLFADDTHLMDRIALKKAQLVIPTCEEIIIKLAISHPPIEYNYFNINFSHVDHHPKKTFQEF